MKCKVLINSVVVVVAVEVDIRAVVVERATTKKLAFRITASFKQCTTIVFMNECQLLGYLFLASIIRAGRGLDKKMF